MKFLPTFVGAWFCLCGFTLVGTLRWQNNATNHDGFIIEQSVNNGLYSEIIRVPATVTFYEFGTSDTRKVCFRVRAFNKVGNSAPSSPRCVSRWSVTVN